jgi:hypothetical protein
MSIVFQRGSCGPNVIFNLHRDYEIELDLSPHPRIFNKLPGV